MTERPLFTVDPGESDTPTKLDEETNVDKLIKICKITKSKTYSDDPRLGPSPVSYGPTRMRAQSGTIKGLVFNTLRFPSSSAVLPFDLRHCYQNGELNLSGKHLSPSTLFSLICSHGHEFKKLDLSGCDLFYVDWRCLERLSGLEELNLSNNPLWDLDLEFLKHMQHSLKKLDLSGCHLRRLDLRCLERLSGLEELNLSNNPLHSIKLHSFKSMPGLRTLDISGCGLADKDLKDFALWDGVKELNLSNNPLSHMLQYPGNLRKLNLSGCCLTKWPSGLEECSSLEELDLSNNSFGHQLENFPPSVSGLSNLNKIMFEDAVYTKNDKG